MAPVKGRSVSVCTCCTVKCLYVRMRSLQAYGEDLRASLCAGKRMEQSSASQGCSLLINESLQLLQCLQPMLRLFICFVNCSLWLACGLREASLLDGTYCRMIITASLFEPTLHSTSLLQCHTSMVTTDLAHASALCACSSLSQSRPGSHIASVLGSMRG